jgi:toxin FitB
VKYLVDANVLSELTRSNPAREVVNWLSNHESEIAVDPIILGELEFGILRLPSGRKRDSLERWFERTLGSLTCLPFGTDCARQWARLLSDLRRKGVAMPIKDSLIAATALEHGLTLVTHNTRDFRRAGVRLLDPFRAH